MQSTLFERTACVAASTLFCSATAQGAPSYHVVDLGPAFVAVAINSNDEVAGADLMDRPAVYKNGTWQRLPVHPPGESGYVKGLSSKGTVAGFIGSGGPETAVIWMPNGRLVVIREPGLTRDFSMQSIAVADDGTVVGAAQSYYGLASPSWMFTWRADVGITRIGVPPGGSNALPTSINTGDQIVGQAAFAGQPLPGHAFFYAQGQWTDLGTLGGASSQANALNDAAHVVGCADLAAPWTFHAFLYEGGTMSDLGSPEGTTSCASGVSADDTVIGAWNVSGKRPKPFIWKDGRMYTRIAKLTDGGDAWSYWELDSINAAGVIAGLGALNGDRHVFLLEPVAVANSVPVP
jgi:probable HAF family extracellular repeat protein